MRPNDYIAYEDAMALTDSEYESFLNYIKFIGFHVLRSANERDRSYNLPLLLDEDGDLLWFPKKWLNDRSVRIPLEEVKRMAALGMIE